MALFQNSVLNKYIKLQDHQAIEKAYKKYTKYFLNAARQQNIRDSKEEQFQEGFLRELFVNILDYTLNPEPNFNLTTELKNEKNAKKTDGAILNNGQALAVIELKSTKTKDLESIRQQAFDYKANQTGCVYVITSNFEKIRFYINNAVDFEEFNLFTLNLERFTLMYLCLHKSNLLHNIPLKIKTASVVEEEKITKTFYNDYSIFKRELFRDLVKQNMKNQVFRNEIQKEDTEQVNKKIKLALFKTSQKLIDRFLFIFFAEDRGLLPPNSTLQILKKWKADVDFGDVRPLYNLFKTYFHFLDTGRKETGSRAEIFAYNGGLFKPDPILDSLIIDDKLLYKHTKQLSDYDFESQVDVNILGHIFENSLNEIESVNAEIEETDFDKQKTKRKKDGVFYTPKYITKYIVDNTVGKLCTEKKTELNIVEEDFNPKRQKETKKKLLASLETYREWLLQLTICDPACGSGAFLNQALDFLIKEHQDIDELQTNLLGGGFVFPNIENTVLENNIFGVDLNEESVEIAKLSLWLRTAQPRRKLNTLNNNIKCGNSLIDDPKVAGDKAFNWGEEFPQVFKEKDKKTYHITTAIHDSRTSARMEKYKVREKREMGTNPYPNIIYFTKEDDLLITETIADIVKEDNLNMLAYNICADHIHLLIVCDIDEVPKIMQKIKGKTSFVHNNYNVQHNGLSNGLSNVQYNGLKPIAKKKKKPLWQQKYSAPKEVTNQEQLQNTINYIQKNRSKHELPEHSKQIKGIIQKMCTDYISATNKQEYFGGFDVVIGNPPYVTRGISEALKQVLNSKFQTAQYQLDLYVAFIERGVNLIKKNGFISYIVPNSWLKNMMMSECRKFLLQNLDIHLMTPSLDNVFPDASVDTMIFIGSKQKIGDKTEISEFRNQELFYRHTVNQARFLENDGYIFDVEVSEKVLPIVQKMQTEISFVGELFDVIRGINPYDKYTGQSQEIIKTRAYHADYPKGETFVPELKGLHTSRYLYSWDNKHYISYGDWLAAQRNIKYFEGDRIIFREILGKTLVSTLIKEDFKIDRSLYIAKLEENKKESFDTQYILGILNSKLMAFYFRYTNNEFDNLFPKIRVAEFKKLPIKNIHYKLQSNMSQSVGLMLSNSKNLQDRSIKFQKYLQSQFAIEKLSKKLQNWYELDFSEFIKELNKAIKKHKGLKPLGKLDEMDWMDVFETKKAEAQTLKTKIDKTDAEIDAMVYELYGLSEEEIKIVEGSN